MSAPILSVVASPRVPAPLVLVEAPPLPPPPLALILCVYARLSSSGRLYWSCPFFAPKMSDSIIQLADSLSKPVASKHDHSLAVTSSKSWPSSSSSWLVVLVVAVVVVVVVVAVVVASLTHVACLSDCPSVRPSA